MSIRFATATPRIGTSLFDRWFAGSQVTTREGVPLRLYRGRRERSGTRFSMPSYTDIPEVASMYAAESGFKMEYVEGSQVEPVYMRLLRPLKLQYALTRFSQLARLLPALRGHLAVQMLKELVKRSQGRGVGDAFGYRVVRVNSEYPADDLDPSAEEFPLVEADIGAMLRGRSTLVQFAEVVRDEGIEDDGTIFNLYDIEEPERDFDGDDEDSRFDVDAFDLVADTYAFVDTQAFATALRAAKYDGVVHKDLIGESTFKEVTGKDIEDIDTIEQEQAPSATHDEIIDVWTHWTWRPLNPVTQVVPAVRRR